MSCQPTGTWCIKDTAEFWTGDTVQEGDSTEIWFGHSALKMSFRIGTVPLQGEHSENPVFSCTDKTHLHVEILSIVPHRKPLWCNWAAHSKKNKCAYGKFWVCIFCN